MTRWPSFTQVNVNEQFGSQLQLCDNNGWLVELQLPLRIGHARARIRLQGNKALIALPSLLIIVYPNFVKVVYLYMTLGNCSSEYIFTVGDAVAFLLESGRTQATMSRRRERASCVLTIKSCVRCERLEMVSG